MGTSSPVLVPDQVIATSELRQARRHPVLRFIVRRVLAGVATLLVASMLIFGTVQLLPGDVATVVLGKNGTPQALAAVRADLHLDRPFLVRYEKWLTGVLSGDLGHSSAAVAQGDASSSVGAAIGTPLVNSLALAGVTVLVLVPLALLFGVTAALHAGRPTDHAISLPALVLSSLPEFLIGSVLILVFFSQLHLLPPVSRFPAGQSPLADPKLLILPVFTLLGVSLAAAIRMVRAGAVEVLRRDYVAMARLNGLSESRVVWRYALRNALAPSVQVLALTIQYLIGGIIITESVFAYPGIGSALVTAVQGRDVQTVEDIAVILAVAYVTVNILADLAVVLLVPKLRSGSE